MHVQDDESTPPRLRHRVLRAGWWAGGGFLLDKMIAAIQLVILVRALTPADFGLMAASAAVLLAMLTISELGVESALIAKENVTDEDLATAWTLSVLRGLMMAMGVWMTAGMISELMRMPELGRLLQWHAWALVIQGVQSPALALMMKTFDLKRRVTLDIVRRGVEAIVTLSIALLYRTVWALVIGQVAGLVVGCLLSYWVTGFSPRWSLKRTTVSYFIQYGSRLNITTLCAFMVMTGGELVVGRVLGAEGLGLYQIALAIPLLIGARATALMQKISVPTYASLQRDRHGFTRAFNLQVGLVGIAYVPLALVIWILAPLLVPIVFGTQWIGIVDALKVLCLYVVCSGYASVMASLHYGIGRPELQMRGWIGQCIAYLVMIFPLTNSLGVWGAAVSLTASYIFGVVLQIQETRRVLGWSGYDIFVSFSRTAIIGLLAGALLCAVQSQYPVAIHWRSEALALPVVGLFGWYLWWIERPRLNALWSYQSHGVQV